MYGRTVFPLYFMLALACIGVTPDRAPAGQTEAAAPETFSDKFLPYEPIYAVVGVDGLDTAKFQLSFKYRFIDHLYLGYSQTTVWDIEDQSAPFRDTSHRPTLFYHFKERGPNNPGRRSWLGVAVGGEHESNGKAGADSRSLNTVYLRPVFTVEDPGKSRLRIIPEIIYFTSVSGGNQDIAEYRGHVDLLVIYDMEKGFGWLDGVQIAGFVRKGTEKNRWTTQIDISWHIGSLGHVYVQFFKGWGETLLNYNERSDTPLRIGFMFWRW